MTDPTQPPHSDDIHLESFRAALSQKLFEARAKGRSGWETCAPQILSDMLRDHVEKGDPRDVANFCMFLFSLGSPILPRQHKPWKDIDTTQLVNTLRDVAKTYANTEQLRARIAEVIHPVAEMIRHLAYPVQAQMAELEAEPTPSVLQTPMSPERAHRAINMMAVTLVTELTQAMQADAKLQSASSTPYDPLQGHYGPNATKYLKSVCADLLGVQLES